MNLSVESSPNMYKANTKQSNNNTTTSSPKVPLPKTPSMIVPTKDEKTVHLLVPKNSGKLRSASFSSSSSSSSSSGSSYSPAQIQQQQQQQLYDNSDDASADYKDYNYSHQTPQQQETPFSPQEEEENNVRLLSRNFKECARDDLLILISRMLTHIISLNDEIDISSKQLTRFHSRAPPNISIYSYLSRLAHYSSLENAVLITAIYYIDLLSSTYPIFSINSLTVHRFLLTATTVGSKGLCDSFCSNNHYAKVGGVHISELNVLELEFLTNVNWRVVPRDFTQQESTRRDSNSSCTGTLHDDVFSKNYRLGVASLEEVLDLYYRRMIALFGIAQQKQQDIPDSNIKFVLDKVLPGAPLKRSADHIGTSTISSKRR